jgi:hypothetical protein
MSRCPDWRRLDPADRDAPNAPHAAARWREALRHLDSGCPRCRQEALAADPTLIFRRLPAPELDAAQEAEEVAAARLAVAAMRTASRLEGRQGAPVRSTGAALGSLPSLRSLRSPQALHTLQPVHAARWVLAAGLTAMALVFGSGHGWHGAPGTHAGSAVPGSPLSASAASETTPDGGMALPGRGLSPGAPGMPGVLPASSRPSIEGLSRPEARVYQLDSPHMSVVMIVDAKLDV